MLDIIAYPIAKFIDNNIDKPWFNVLALVVIILIATMLISGMINHASHETCAPVLDTCLLQNL